MMPKEFIYAAMLCDLAVMMAIVQFMVNLYRKRNDPSQPKLLNYGIKNIFGN
jgi:hypothetical protein